jgi:hypothetical protein
MKAGQGVSTYMLDQIGTFDALTLASNHQLISSSFQDVSELYLLDPVKPIVLIPA